jgi:hypothetical protein
VNIQEMHRRYKVYLDKLDTFAYPNIPHNQIDIFLNKAQIEVIKTKYSGNNSQRESVESVEKRRDDLSAITTDYYINTSAIATTLNNKPNGVFVPLPSSSSYVVVNGNKIPTQPGNPNLYDYYFTLQDEADINVDDCSHTLTGPPWNRAIVRPVTHDEYSMLIRDPFNKPNEEFVLKLVYNTDNTINTQYIELIAGTGIKIQNYYLRYLRKPKNMHWANTNEDDIINNISCELADEVQEEMIDRAVTLTLETIESPRFATQSVNSTKNE